MSEEKLTYEMLSEDQKAVFDYNLPDQYYRYKLKGTVVHFGTVDGGHYYSYIKERGTDRWYEFNDTTVRDYDPADLADDTFGGTYQHEKRTDRSGKVVTQTERLHNAYVLIYEREEFIDSTKLIKTVDAGESDFRKLLNECTIPLPPLKIEDDILNELTVTYDKNWIANKMFEDSFIGAVLGMCQSGSAYIRLSSERSAEHAMDLDDSDEELCKLRLATSFTLGVVLRSDSRIRFAEQILPQLIKTAGASLSYSQWVIGYFSTRHAINEFFASNWSPDACRLVNALFAAALRRVHTHEKDRFGPIAAEMVNFGSRTPADGVRFLRQYMEDPDSAPPLTLACLYQFMLVLLAKVQDQELSLLGNFLFFGALNDFANLDAEFRRVMINFRVHTAWVACAFSSDIPVEELAPGVEFTAAELSLDKSPGSGSGNTNEPQTPKLSKADRAAISGMARGIEPFLCQFKLMSKLMRSCRVLSEDEPAYSESPYRMENEEPLGDVQAADVGALTQPNDSVMKVLFGTRCASKPLRNELGKLFGHLLFGDARSIPFWKTLITHLTEATFFEIRFYERILFCVFTLEDQHWKRRTEAVFRLLTRTIESNGSEFAYMENLTAMLIKFAKRSASFRKLLYEDRIVDRVNNWLLK